MNDDFEPVVSLGAQVCPDCGADIVDGGSCFYCETYPEEPAVRKIDWSFIAGEVIYWSGLFTGFLITLAAGEVFLALLFCMLWAALHVFRAVNDVNYSFRGTGNP